VQPLSNCSKLSSAQAFSVPGFQVGPAKAPFSLQGVLNAARAPQPSSLTCEYSRIWMNKGTQNITKGSDCAAYKAGPASGLYIPGGSPRVRPVKYGSGGKNRSQPGKKANERSKIRPELWTISLGIARKFREDAGCVFVSREEGSTRKNGNKGFEHLLGSGQRSGQSWRKCTLRKRVRAGAKS
jgi:hypothetical protein